MVELNAVPTGPVRDLEDGFHAGTAASVAVEDQSPV
jgi:hypothetical protein